MSDQRPGIDGCGIPVFAISLQRLAFAMARLVDPTDLPSETAAATEPILSAARRTFWVSGTDRTEDQIGEVATEPVEATPSIRSFYDPRNERVKI